MYSLLVLSLRQDLTSLTTHLNLFCSGATLRYHTAVSVHLDHFENQDQLQVSSSATLTPSHEFHSPHSAKTHLYVKSTFALCLILRPQIRWLYGQYLLRCTNLFKKSWVGVFHDDLSLPSMVYSVHNSNLRLSSSCPLLTLETSDLDLHSAHQKQC